MMKTSLGGTVLLWEIIIIVKRHIHVGIREILAVVQEYYFARKHGVAYVKGLFEQKPDRGMYADSEGYGGSAYAHISTALDRVKITSQDVFVDLGCGRGRVVYFAALRRPRKVVGVELVKEYVDRARHDARRITSKLQVPIEIHHADAAEFRVDEGTVYYLYNPFGVHTLASVIENIRASLAANPRQVRIIYYNPVYELVLENAGWLEKKQQFTSASLSGTVNISVWGSRKDYVYVPAGKTPQYAAVTGVVPPSTVVPGGS